MVPVPGPSIAVAALVVSGLPTDRFTYLGFLPHKAGDRRRFLKSVVDELATLIILETPHRLKEALTDISDILGNRRITVCRELTKLHEEIFRGTVSDAIAHFIVPRGEFALVIEGKREVIAPEMDDVIAKRLQNMRLSGMTAKETIAVLSKETGLPRKKLYRAWLKSGSSSDKKIDK